MTLMTGRVQNPWAEVNGFAGFAIFLPAVAGSADPCTGVTA